MCSFWQQQEVLGTAGSCCLTPFSFSLMNKVEVLVTLHGFPSFVSDLLCTASYTISVARLGCSQSEHNSKLIVAVSQYCSFKKGLAISRLHAQGWVRLTNDMTQQSEMNRQTSNNLALWKPWPGWMRIKRQTLALHLCLCVWKSYLSVSYSLPLWMVIDP